MKGRMDEWEIFAPGNCRHKCELSQKITLLRHMTTCVLLEVQRRFRGTCCVQHVDTRKETAKVFPLNLQVYVTGWLCQYLLYRTQSVYKIRILQKFSGSSTQLLQRHLAYHEHFLHGPVEKKTIYEATE
jgi:hypothetical protein